MDPHATLGVSRDATAEQIRAAYKRAVLRCHPDKAGRSTSTGSPSADMVAVQAAYAALAPRVPGLADAMYFGSVSGLHEVETAAPVWDARSSASTSYPDAPCPEGEAVEVDLADLAW